MFASILAPVLLALVLVIGVHPLTGILRRHGAPQWLAVTITLLLNIDPNTRWISDLVASGPSPPEPEPAADVANGGRVAKPDGQIPEDREPGNGPPIAPP